MTRWAVLHPLYIVGDIFPICLYRTFFNLFGGGVHLPVKLGTFLLHLLVFLQYSRSSIYPTFLRWAGGEDDDRWTRVGGEHLCTSCIFYHTSPSRARERASSESTGGRGGMRPGRQRTQIAIIFYLYVGAHRAARSAGGGSTEGGKSWVVLACSAAGRSGLILSTIRGDR